MTSHYVTMSHICIDCTKQPIWHLKFDLAQLLCCCWWCWLGHVWANQSEDTVHCIDLKETGAKTELWTLKLDTYFSFIVGKCSLSLGCVHCRGQWNNYLHSGWGGSSQRDKCETEVHLLLHWPSVAQDRHGVLELSSFKFRIGGVGVYKLNILHQP